MDAFRSQPSDFDAVQFKLRSMYAARKHGRHEEHVFAALGPLRELRHAGGEFAIIARVHRREGFCSEIAQHSAHDVQVQKCMSSRREYRPASIWMEVQEVFGERQAAITLAAIFQRSNQIKTIGGYLRSLTDRAREGKFSAWPLIMALLGAKLDRHKARPSAERCIAGVG